MSSIEMMAHNTDKIGREANYHRNEEAETKSVVNAFLWSFSMLLIMATFPFSLFACIEIVREYERLVLFRLGRLNKRGSLGPGIHFVVPCIDTVRRVDLRTVTFDIPPQEVLTKDSVTVSVNAVLYFRILDPVIAVSNVRDCRRSTQLLAASTLRNVLGSKNFSELISGRDLIAQAMQDRLKELTTHWGVQVERIEMKDIRLPEQLQRAMAAEAEATREARATVISAEGEKKASRALLEAAEIMADTPSALQLRYLQTLSTMAAEKPSTVLFPIPIEML